MSEDYSIDFPFQLVIKHPSLGVKRMFELTRLLDFHEVREPVKGLEKARNDLVVDVIHIKETETKIEVKPRGAMTYDAIAAELDSIMDVLSKKFQGKVKVTELDWLVDRKGMASDMRSTQRRVM